MLRFPSAADTQRTGAGAQARGTVPEGPQGRGPRDGAASVSSKAFSERGRGSRSCSQLSLPRALAPGCPAPGGDIPPFRPEPSWYKYSHTLAIVSDKHVRKGNVHTGIRTHTRAQVHEQRCGYCRFSTVSKQHPYENSLTR